MDIVMSQEAFTHACSGLDKAIAEAARVLKPGGLLVFSDILQSDDADAHRMAEVGWGGFGPSVCKGGRVVVFARWYIPALEIAWDPMRRFVA